MKSIEPALASYLDYLGIADKGFQPIDDTLRKLPLFLVNSYDFRTTRLFNKSFVLLLRRGRSSPTPAQALKHMNMVEDSFGKKVIFVLADLESFNRRRWVENGLSFIVPGKFFFCPMYLVDFRESARHPVRVPDDGRKSISASTQALLLAYLLHNPPCTNLTDWAGYLHYTRMTASRARRELEANNLCDVHRSGKSMTLDFTVDRRSLWEQAVPFLRNPVLRTKEVEIADSAGLLLLRSGISGLSDLSMLADNPLPTYAMSSATYKAAFEAGKITENPSDSARSALIEHWSYAPSVLATEGNTVDRLSLYLSLQNSPDARVQGELETMMENMPW